MFLSGLVPDKKLALLCIVMCDSEGVMYWGDASIDVLETAYINGSGRRPILTETYSHYFAFYFHDGNIYITDWAWPYVCLCSFALDPCDKITNNRGTDTAHVLSSFACAVFLRLLLVIQQVNAHTQLQTIKTP